MYQKYDLPYAFNALEPAIDALTMETHSTKHHAAYTKVLNETAEKAGVADKDIVDLLANLSSVSDEAARKTLRNNGGGFYNHNIYFSTMTPGGSAPEGQLKAAIERDFGSLDALKEKLAALGAGQFGSGWAWLSCDKDGKLYASNSPNQDNPIIEGTGHTPIFGIDVWEHAYYLKYKNVRADYIKEFWAVVDWKKVGEYYEKAIA